MSKTYEEVVWKITCKTCGAGIGEDCRNRKGLDMNRLVHPARMICPICEKPYAERSGNGFRHWTPNGNVWHRLSDVKGT